MDHKPLPAPFPKGTTLRYIGRRSMWIEAADVDRTPVPIYEHGLVVTVEKVEHGYRGTLRPLPGEWEDEPPLDTTRNGYSVYYVDVPGRRRFARIIWPEDASDWERV